MKKTSLKIERPATGEMRIFRTAKEAADHIGVSEQSVRYALKNGSFCKGCRVTETPTLCVVRTVEGEYYVCSVADGGYDIMGDGGYIQEKEVKAARDVTENMWGVRLGKNDA